MQILDINCNSRAKKKIFKKKTKTGEMSYKYSGSAGSFNNICQSFLCKIISYVSILESKYVQDFKSSCGLYCITSSIRTVVINHTQSCQPKGITIKETASTFLLIYIYLCFSLTSCPSDKTWTF